MAKNTTMSLPQREWTELTDADVSSVTVQNQSGYDIYLLATAGTAPSLLGGAILVQPYKIAEALSLASVWPGVTGPVRLFAYAPNGASVMVSHA